jgi:hypothetical protein
MAMNVLRWLTVAVALVAAAVLAGTADAQERMKHSGTIVAIDERAGTIQLAEIGPWQVRDGETVITYRTIVVTPATTFAILGRDNGAADGWPGELVETPLPPDGLYVDDYVTVDCLHEGGKQIALKITVTEVFN